MNTLIIVLSVTFLIIVAIFKHKKLGNKAEISYQYHKVNRFMDQYEHGLYHTLVTLFHDRYLIFAKPRVEDILKVDKGLTRSQYATLRNYIKSNHTDFLLCDRTTSEPLIAIELDGSSHKKKSRKDRDNRMNDIYASAGMQYVHIPIGKREDQSYIMTSISSQNQT